MKLACLPAFNEETAIGSVVLKTRQFVDKVVVIDDGSTDDTVALARLAGAEVLCHDRNKGYGAAIQSCFAAAKTENADVMVIIDADGQHYAEDIPKLISPVLNDGYDFVIGSRFLDNDTIFPKYRKFGIQFLTTPEQYFRNGRWIRTDTLCKRGGPENHRSADSLQVQRGRWIHS